jgi:hypothetical protein
MGQPLHDSDRCPVCRQARFSTRMETVDLHQWTDKGLVRYPASIGIAACPDCGFRSWGNEVVAVMREALRRAYEDAP